jgi:hypothetical protein
VARVTETLEHIAAKHTDGCWKCGELKRVYVFKKKTWCDNCFEKSQTEQWEANEKEQDELFVLGISEVGSESRLYHQGGKRVNIRYDPDLHWTEEDIKKLDDFLKEHDEKFESKFFTNRF